MKKQFLVLLLGLLSFGVSAQALTSDQKVAISNDATFQNRVAEVLREKAQYWQNSTTVTRASVNRQLQKRKRLSKSILQSSWVDSYKTLVSLYWLTQYTDNPALVDGNGIPTVTAISNTFDPTFDYWAGYVTGDENLTEIDW